MESPISPVVAKLFEINFELEDLSTSAYPQVSGNDILMIPLWQLNHKSRRVP